MLTGQWPARDQRPELDMSQVQAEVAARDADAFAGAVRGEEPTGRALSVNLDDMAELLDSTDYGLPGYYRDVTDGAVYPATVVDAGAVGADSAIDVETDPDRWYGRARELLAGQGIRVAER